MANDGKQLEHLVRLIEKSITPEAKVEHDVDMPIINSRIGATTQCDIVIRSGISPRQTTTIVEVQDRKSKVKPNDFRGWVQKLEDVGAQHLICVSKQDFPKSIREQAALSSGKVILMTLQEAEPDFLPIGFINFNYQYFHYDITSLNFINVSISERDISALGLSDQAPKKAQFNMTDLCWSIDGQNLISLFTLCRDHYSIPKELLKGTGKIKFDTESSPTLYHLVKEELVRACMECEFSYEKIAINKSVSVLSYSQDEHGVLAWVAEIEHNSPKGKIVLKIPLVKSDDGYMVRSVYTEKRSDIELTMSISDSSDKLIDEIVL